LGFHAVRTSRIALQGVPVEMVDEKKVKKILPTLLTVGDNRYSSSHSEYVAKEKKLRRIARNNPSFFRIQLRKAVKVMDEIEKALKEDFDW
jgi:hypothetical protein